MTDPAPTIHGMETRLPGIAAAEIVLRRLSSAARLPPDDEALVRAALARTELYPAGAELYAEGGLAHRPQMILSGWACRLRMLPDGRRQIFSFLLPGDGVGMGRPPRPLARAITMALTRVETCDGSTLLDAAEQSGGRESALGLALDVAGARDEAYLLDQVVRLGRQTAYERMAHLLLELRDRLAVVCLGDQTRFPVPLTQEALADALGLSVVHVNRTLQQMRRERLIEMRAGAAILLDPATLERAADYRRPGPSFT